MRRTVILLTAAISLGGCEGLTGLGGALVSTIGGGAVESFEEKKAAISQWKIERARLLGKKIDRMEQEAEKLFAAGTYAEGLEMLDKILAEHDGNQPLWLIQKYIRGRANGEAN